MPPLLAQALRRQQGGDLAGAEGLYRQLLLQRPGLPDALHLLGLCGPEIRLPLTRMTEPNRERLQVSLKDLGLL